MTLKEEMKFRFENWFKNSNAYHINQMDNKEASDHIIDEMLNLYIEKMTHNTCIFPHIKSIQDYHDEMNHSEMSDLFSKIMVLSHEFNGMNGCVDVIEKIRRVQMDAIINQLEGYEEKTNEK